MRDSGIIILTAAGSEAARISAIEWGADDAMTKPVNLTELSARIAAVLRRSGPRGARFDDGRLTVDVATRAVRLGGHPVHLGRKEFDLLAFFIRHANEVLTRQRILASVWSLPPGSATRTLDAHVKTLRRKIGRERITTVIGCGYRFEAAHEAIPGFRPGA